MVMNEFLIQKAMRKHNLINMAYKTKNKRAKERGLYKVLDFEKKHGLTFVGNVGDIFDKENLNKSETKFTIKKLEEDGMVFDKKDKSYLVEQAEFRDKPYIRFGAKPTIRTLKGTAYYVRTDVEDDQEHWAGNNLSTNDGFYIIHTGKLHHIYQI